MNESIKLPKRTKAYIALENRLKAEFEEIMEGVVALGRAEEKKREREKEQKM